MIRVGSNQLVREIKKVAIHADLVVVGGGITGVCCAITAARKGSKVCLIQDRPVLGGNASSEVRLWILGATSHMGNNNRWSREGGVIDELLLENLYRNKEGNTIILDTILLEKVKKESNITLLLNTSVYSLTKKDETTIAGLTAFCSQNSTEYSVDAGLYCDASGDGIVGYLSGASFRMGAETQDEFGEAFTPGKEYGELLGHTMYFYSKDTGKPVEYVAPEFALKDITKIPRFKSISTGQTGCNFWWFEYGGRGDTIHDTENIKWELWSVIYGVWDYIKNSGQFPEAENLTLEWVGTIPGKRESRRFEGLYMLKQQDIVEQVHFNDQVAFGGWAIDLHPADGVFSELPACNQYHAKGTYGIPYRCYVSKDINNLFLAGRLISASHVAFGSTRVMATCGHGGQAVGMAAAICVQKGLLPRDLLHQEHLNLLQNELNLTGQSLLGLPIAKEDNLMTTANIKASSQLQLNGLPGGDQWYRLDYSAAQLLPLKKNTPYSFELVLDALEDTELQVELQVSTKPYNYTPDQLIEHKLVPVEKGRHKIRIDFQKSLQHDQYAFLIFRSNPVISIQCSSVRVTGVLSVFHKTNPSVNNHSIQLPPENSGFDSFEFWCPERRPKGKNFAINIYPGIDAYSPENLQNGLTRPYLQSNAWVADLRDPAPSLFCEWQQPQVIHSITLFFDTDFDHPLESSQMGHPESKIPFCVKNYKIKNGIGQTLYEKSGNFQTINQWVPEQSLIAQQLHFEFEHPDPEIPASIFQIYIS